MFVINSYNTALLSNFEEKCRTYEQNINENDIMLLMRKQVKIIRQERRTLQITVSKHGEIVVKAPIGLTDQKINEFVNQKKEWISQKLRLHEQRTQKAESLSNRTFITLLGERVDILLASVTKSEILNSNLLLPVNKCKCEADKNKAIQAFLTKKAKEILPQMLAQIAAKLSVCPTDVKIKHSTAKWGSCDSNGMIMLNSKLIMLPYELIEYVLLHELCHLVALNHSSEFWSLVQRFLPHYKSLRTQLKEYSLLLQ